MNPFHAKYFEDVKCRRHGEAACPSCLSYALSDANAAAAKALAEVAELRDEVRKQHAWMRADGPCPCRLCCWEAS